MVYLFLNFLINVMCVYLLFLLFSLNISRTSKCWNVRISTSDRFLDVEPFYIIALCMYFYCFLISNLPNERDACLFTLFLCEHTLLCESIKDANEKNMSRAILTKLPTHIRISFFLESILEEEYFSQAYFTRYKK